MSPATRSSSAAPLSAPLILDFDYTRSLGPILGGFMTALRDRRILGIRGSDGRVHAPPVEYDPVTAEPLTELVEVAAQGEVVSWSWMPTPLEGQPLSHPFAWALIRLDGADTNMLHAVDAPPEQIRTGLRVRARWVAEPIGSIRDIECFEPLDRDPGETPPASVRPTEPVTMLTAPIHLEYLHTASHEESNFLRGLLEGRLIGQRCPVCEKVYVPPRSACPVDGVATVEQVELPDTGTITTFCIVNVPFLGQRITPPYVAAYVLLDGADIAFLHLILECSVQDVRMGMRVQAVWRPREQWGPTLENIDHFRPTGEPDAPYESYAQHL
ncbi:MAG TPA: OB-fold domain-containing protein [Kineosporiaceae bacterium]|nr:OB-fold domain-containing protein [Kineosporiaceae bacterium]